MIENIPIDKDRLIHAALQSYRWAVAGMVAGFVNITTEVNTMNLTSVLLLLGILVVGITLATPIEYIIRGVEKKRE
jgi:hypothetical protein